MLRVGDLREVLEGLPDHAYVIYNDGWNWLPVLGATAGIEDEDDDHPSLRLYHDE